MKLTLDFFSSSQQEWIANSLARWVEKKNRNRPLKDGLLEFKDLMDFLLEGGIDSIKKDDSPLLTPTELVEGLKTIYGFKEE